MKKVTELFPEIKKWKEKIDKNLAIDIDIEPHRKKLLNSLIKENNYKSLFICNVCGFDTYSVAINKKELNKHESFR
jgi:rubrerythrin